MNRYTASTLGKIPNVKVIEGYVYRYCHADDCHAFLYPKKLDAAEVAEIAERWLRRVWSNEKVIKEQVEEIVHDLKNNNTIDWIVFYDIEKMAEVPCYILEEEYLGKKVRIYIEVIE